jgi:hypothetical protein
MKKILRIKNDPYLAAILVKNGKKSIRKKFSLMKQLDLLEEIYKQ